MTERSEIAQGIQLEAPHLWIPWDMTMAEFIQVFADHTQAAPRLVSPGDYVARCQLLRGLVAQVGFHFEPSDTAGRLNELELFDNGERDIEQSYRLFHERLVRVFGEPSKHRTGALGTWMPDCQWRIGSVTIVHYVMDRFGPREHLRFRKGRAIFPVMRPLLTAFVVALRAPLSVWWSWEWHP